MVGLPLEAVGYIHGMVRPGYVACWYMARVCCNNTRIPFKYAWGL